MKKILTIVVPTFNAKKYLNDNLDSFCIEEILDDIEVLIINDGSTDGSEKIAENYVNKYPETYRLVSKENGGHGSGINCGIQLALGTYLKIVDADDWVDKSAFFKFVQFLKKQNSDIVHTGFLWAFDNGENSKNSYKTKAEIPIPFNGVCFKKEYIFDDIAHKLYIKMHNLTIKTEILRMHNIIIDENCYYVDTEFILYPIPYIKTVCFLNEFVYMYRIHSNGQSIDIYKMQKNKGNYRKVLSSLFHFYSNLDTSIPCSAIKKHYIERIIARVVAGYVKIILSLPPTAGRKAELALMQKCLQTRYPSIYNANINLAIKVLRKTNYLLYYPASWIFRISCYFKAME